MLAVPCFALRAEKGLDFFRGLEELATGKTGQDVAQPLFGSHCLVQQNYHGDRASFRELRCFDFDAVSGRTAVCT